MVLDITAIRNYQDVNTMRELSMNFEMDKIILLLDDSNVVNSPNYLSQLVSFGIYNFTRNVDTIPFLIQNPNSYKDVATYQNFNSSPMPNMNNNNYQQPKMGQSNNQMMGGNNYNNYNNYGNYNNYDANPYIEQRIIGFKNITEHAGATTLIYMLKKQLEKAYHVTAIEIDENDFSYFNDPTLESSDFMNVSFKISNAA